MKRHNLLSYFIDYQQEQKIKSKIIVDFSPSKCVIKVELIIIKKRLICIFFLLEMD